MRMNQAQPTLPQVMAVLGTGFLFLLAASALPHMEQGVPPAVIFGAVLGSAGFWLRTVLVLGTIAFFLVSVLPLLFCWMTQRPGGSFNWQRARLTFTVFGAVFLILLGIPIGLELAGRRFLPAGSLPILLVLWIAYALFIGIRWRMNPSPEMIEAFETGNETRLNDERSAQVMGKSAVTTLGWLAGFGLSVGSLHEILVYRSWPVRSLVELIAMLFIWNLAYRWWDRRI